MKRILLIILIMPFAVFAQKPIKPSIPKAERALRAGEYADAKAIIDATVAAEKYADNAKAWYLKGLIYAAIDTTTNEAAKSLVADGFPEAKAAFNKAYELDPDNGSYVNGSDGFPLMTDQVNAYLAQKYFDKGIKAYQDNQDYKEAWKQVERTLYFIPEDTSILMNAGLFFAPSADENEKAIKHLNKYLELGGTSADAYTMLFSIYRDEMKDDEKALEIVKNAMKAHPGNEEFPKYQLDMFIRMDKLVEAKSAMEAQAASDPTDTETRYFLGVISERLEDKVTARKWYDEAVKIDPNYFEPRLAIAELVFFDAKKVKQQMNQLGITADDRKKRFELDKVLVENLKKALPYWEAAEKVSPDDEKVLDNLYSIYSDLDMQSQMTRIEKKMKALGLN